MKIIYPGKKAGFQNKMSITERGRAAAHLQSEKKGGTKKGRNREKAVFPGTVRGGESQSTKKKRRDPKKLALRGPRSMMNRLESLGFHRILGGEERRKARSATDS